MGRPFAGRRRRRPRRGSPHRAGRRAGGHGAGVGGRQACQSDRYRLVPAVSVDLDDPSDRLDRGDGPWPGSIPTPSPTVVPRRPVPVELIGHDGRAGECQRSRRGQLVTSRVDRRRRPSSDRGLGRSVADRAALVGSGAFATPGTVPGRHRSRCRPSRRDRATALVDPRHVLVTRRRANRSVRRRGAR